MDILTVFLVVGLLTAISLLVAQWFQYQRVVEERNGLLDRLESIGRADGGNERHASLLVRQVGQRLAKMKRGEIVAGDHVGTAAMLLFLAEQQQAERPPAALHVVGS